MKTSCCLKSQLREWLWTYGTTTSESTLLSVRQALVKSRSENKARRYDGLEGNNCCSSVVPPGLKLRTATTFGVNQSRGVPLALVLNAASKTRHLIWHLPPTGKSSSQETVWGWFYMQANFFSVLISNQIVNWQCWQNTELLWDLMGRVL